MMGDSGYELLFLQDRLDPGARASEWPACNRIVYVVSGSATIAGQSLGADEGRLGADAIAPVAGDGGAELWRWELWPVAAAPDDPALAMRAPITTLEVGDGWLMRLDSVSFPPGGCAYLHVHQGPGIRCLLEGRIRIDSEGQSTSYGPGEPWFEAGPEPVFAQADESEATRFIRAMVLPRALLGERSIRYVRAEDQDKPKSQSYKIYCDEIVAL